jgi:hypothetical protein
MNEFLSFPYVALTIAGASAIVLYATWLFLHRLRKGEKASKSFCRCSEFKQL